MATRNPTVVQGPGPSVVITWTGLLNGDTGAPVNYPEYPDRSIQFLGTFGAGGSIQLEGTNDVTPANYQLMADPQGTDIVKTAADLETVLDVAALMRPNVTAGDGATSLTAIMFARRASR